MFSQVLRAFGQQIIKQFLEKVSSCPRMCFHNAVLLVAKAVIQDFETIAFFTPQNSHDSAEVTEIGGTEYVYVI